ncbi:CAP domain-containing protein [Paenibacillus thiaminolyticus]|uniref:SCP domain-containing protein n=1 Tax=Paenibacillus thiaminolyticus TaxID=49283 RepID=A0A3A3GEE2_PANTH|nr:hypothetical protein DQX05_19450 [Paenibacillus thiaminolyticus]
MINSLRAAANLSVLKFDESLNKAAQAHANYATAHHSMTHIEGKEKAGFSGALPPSVRKRSVIRTSAWARSSLRPSMSYQRDASSNRCAIPSGYALVAESG